MRVVGIVQARTGSTRLPGKVLLPIAGVPLLAYQLRRLRAAQSLEELVVATTELKGDDAIVALCKREGVATFRGATNDVLARYADAAAATHADAVVRLTADCPLIDPDLVDQVVNGFLNSPEPYDYFSNTLDRSFARGMDVEVVRRAALDRAARDATAEDEREHVTLHLYRRPKQYRLGHMTYRLCVDTAEDFARMEQIMRDHPPGKTAPTYAELMQWMQRHRQFSS